MLLHLVQQGGPLMWPLLACSVALGAALAERLWAHATRRPWETLAAQPATRPGIHPFFWEIPPPVSYTHLTLPTIYSV